MSGTGSIPMPWQVGIALTLMAVVGIPHGAIDHILFMEESAATPVQFYTFYLGLIALYTVAWLFAPAVSMALFLGLSAYHFGQSQFVGYRKIPKLSKGLLNCAWGISVISGLVFFNFEEIVGIAAQSPDVVGLLSIFNKQVYEVLLIGSSALTVVLLVLGTLQKNIRFEKFISELYTLALIQVCFYLTPLLIGFSLYFAILHSLKVLNEEYQFLRERRSGLTLKNFIVLLTPFTLLSVVGSAIIYILSATGIINMSEVLLILILISVLTLPHSIVMNGFYDKMFRPSGVPATSKI